MKFDSVRIIVSVLDIQIGRIDLFVLVRVKIKRRL